MKTIKTTLIMPTLNEVETIEQSLNQLPKDLIDEVLVIDGHSTDGTIELVEKLGYPVIFQEESPKGPGAKGFGSAIATGIKHAQGDTIVIMSADLSQDVKDIPLMLEKINEGYDLVMTSRYMKGGRSDDDTLLHRYGNKFFTGLCNVLHGTKITDCLYFYLAVKKNVFDKFKIETVHAGCCPELPIKAHKAGFKMTDIPSIERARGGGKGKLNAFVDGFKILGTIISL